MAASTEPCLLRQPARSGFMSAAQLCDTAWAACRSARKLASEACCSARFGKGMPNWRASGQGWQLIDECNRGMCSMLATASHLPGEEAYSGNLFAAFAEVV